MLYPAGLLWGCGAWVLHVARPSTRSAPLHCAGRVKTLHPAVHGGILAVRDKPEHMAALDKHKISTIDMVRNGGLGCVLHGLASLHTCMHARCWGVHACVPMHGRRPDP